MNYWSAESSPLCRLNACPAHWTGSFRPSSYTQSCTFPAIGTIALSRGWLNHNLEIMHVAEDREDLVLSPWCPGQETPSGKVIPLGETKKEETHKWQEWGEKTCQGRTEIMLVEGGRQSKTRKKERKKYPVAVIPHEGRKIAKKDVGCRQMSWAAAYWLNWELVAFWSAQLLAWTQHSIITVFTLLLIVH